MKTFTTILIILAIGLAGFNLYLIDYTNPLEGKSSIALVGVVASLCAVLILMIFRISRKIEDKLKN